VHCSFPGGVAVWRTYYVVKLVFQMVVVVSCCCESRITWAGIFSFLFSCCFYLSFWLCTSLVSLDITLMQRPSVIGILLILIYSIY
jgi:hypothetical protein